MSIVNQNEEGVSLLEMSVILSIFVSLTLMVILSSSEGEANLSLQRSSQIITQAVSTARNNSLGAKRFHGEIMSEGWGIYATSNSNNNDKIILFADCNSKTGVTDYKSAGANQCPDGANNSEKAEEFLLEENIIIKEIRGINGTQVSVVFEPPDPRVHFTPELNDSAVEIMIEHPDTGKTYTVFINNAGATRITQ